MPHPTGSDPAEGSREAIDEVASATIKVWVECDDDATGICGGAVCERGLLDARAKRAQGFLYCRRMMCVVVIDVSAIRSLSFVFKRSV